MTPTIKRQFNVALSDDGHALVIALCKHHGLSQAGLVEYLLRKEGRSQKVKTKGSRKR